MLCQLPEEKLLNIKALCMEILSKHWVTIKLPQRLMGPAVQMSRARSRGILRMILDNYRGKSTALDNDVARQPVAHNSHARRKTLKSVMD